MGQLLHCHAEVLSQKLKSTLKNLRISALGNHKWFFNYQREKKLFTDLVFIEQEFKPTKTIQITFFLQQTQDY